MKKIIIPALALISILYIYTTFKVKQDIIPENAIRFRVVANSNTIYDQNIKIQVRNVIQNKILELTKKNKTIEETRKVLEENINTIESLVSDTLNNLEYDKNYKVKYGYNYFPKKEHKGIEYKEGKYESLVITLGDGEGDNWWCVLFPPLCLMETEDEVSKDVEYTFFIKEILSKIFK